MNDCCGYLSILPMSYIIPPRRRCQVLEDENNSIGKALYLCRETIDRQRQTIEALQKKIQGLELTLQAERELRKTENIET